jgi:hypothetical protein
MAPLYGMQCKDVDGDSFIDILLTGNDYGMEIGQGRADALNGLVLKNGGNKKFTPMSFEESGFIVPGDARALTEIHVQGINYLVSTQNRKGLTLFKTILKPESTIKLNPTISSAIVSFSNQRKQKFEFGWGDSFLSQRTRQWQLPGGTVKVEFNDSRGKLVNSVSSAEKN